MYEETIKKYYVLIGVILFFISYVCFYPSNFMITDAYTYASQAIAFSQGDITLTSFDFLTGKTINLIKSPYNTGTGFYYAIFVLLLGKKGIFIGSLVAVLASAILLHYSLKNRVLQSISISLLFISPPLLFYSRSLMSCMPSLLVISIGVWLFSLKKQHFFTYLAYGFITGISIWFRETNSILLLPWCIYAVYKKTFHILPIWLGFGAAIFIKILSSWIVYGKPYFVSASAGFDVINVLSHGVTYAFIGLLLFPVGFLCTLWYKGPGDRSVKVGVAFFVLTYIAYNYTAVPFSGFLKGSMLTSRFMIPLLPFMVLGLAYGIKSYKFVEKIVLYVLVPLSILLIPLGLYSFHQLYKPHQDAASRIAEITKDAPIIYDPTGFTNTIRYINPLTQNLKATSDVRRLTDPSLKKLNQDVKAFVVLSMSTENEEKYNRTHERLFYLEKMPIELIEKLVIDEKNWIDIYRF